MPEKERMRKKWTGRDPVESIDEANELLNTIKANLEAGGEEKEPYYELIGIKIVYDVEK